MLSKITILTAYILAVIYPLCFLIHKKDPLKHNFHIFHLSFPNIIGGLVVLTALLSNMPFYLKGLLIFWQVWLSSTSFLEWKKSSPNPLLVSLPCFFGFYVFCELQSYYLGTSLINNLISILGGFVLCSSLYAMNLGHFYLNVHGLPIKHLKRATYVFWFCVLIRALIDTWYLVVGKVSYHEQLIPIREFILNIDGFFLLIALFFGTLMPLVCNYFVIETIKLKNTQSATGILYVILSAVLLGDLTYKYYLIKYGISM
jgi:hypothetical protein